MKKAKHIFLLITAALCISTTNAQITGLSGANWFDYANPENTQWVLDQINPGDVVSLRFRADKYGDQYPPCLQQLVELAIDVEELGGTLKVTYTASMEADAATNLAAISYLKTAGVELTRVELGNEYYSNTVPKLSFAAYKRVFTPIAESIREVFPGLPLCYPAAPNPADAGFPAGRKDHKIWNDSLKIFLAGQPLQDQITWHTYFNDKVSPILKDTLFKSTVTSAYNPVADSVFAGIYADCMASDLWQVVLNYCNTQFPGREIAVTEFGLSNSGKWRNTWTYSAIMWHNWMAYRTAYAETDIFNGIGPVGVITNRKPMDPPGTVYKRTVEYWVWAMQTRCPQSATELSTSTVLQTAGDHYFYFNNAGASTPVNITCTGVNFKSADIEYITGNYYYSSAGQCEWWGRGSLPSFEIDSTRAAAYTQADQVTIPARSFGYIKITTAAIPKPECPKRCSNWWYRLWNAKKCTDCI